MIFEAVKLFDKKWKWAVAVILLLGTALLLLVYIYFFWTCCPETPRVSCQSEGGFFSEELEFCQLPASDAGKACQDTSECEGFCEADLSPDEIIKIASGEKVEKTGTCGRLKNFASGCFYTIEDGVVDKVCAD